jgi:hypothetical protein
MNIAKRIDQYDEGCVFLCDPIKNNVINDSNFIRMLYSNSIVTLSGVYLIINIKNVICEKYYNKYKCVFSPNDHTDIIREVKNIEQKLLEKVEIVDKTPQYKVFELLKSGVIKIFNEIFPGETTSFILKISGIWETQYSYGLTYKFTPTQNT